MQVQCFLQDSSKGDNIVRTFARGCQGRLVKTYDFVNNPKLDSSPVFLWGCLRGSDAVLRHCWQTNHTFYYADNCYYGDKKFFRITKNAVQNTVFAQRPNDRLAANPIRLQPWRRSGSDIVILPPTESFGHLFQKQQWLEQTIAELKQYTNRPIRVRYKPGETKIGWKNGYMINDGVINRPNISAKSLAEDLANAWAIVAFQSSAVWEAIAMGIPAFVDPVNAASVFGNTDLKQIETPVYADREPYFRHINYCQFTLDEIANGTAWRILNS